MASTPSLKILNCVVLLLCVLHTLTLSSGKTTPYNNDYATTTTTTTHTQLQLNVKPSDAPTELDCKAKWFAWEYAQTVQPWRTNLRDVFDALQLSVLCNYTYSDTASLKSKAKPPPFEVTTTATTIYVDAVNGNDDNQGTLSSPYKTVLRAVQASRGKGGATIYLRGGVYYIGQTIQLGPQDSNLAFSSYNGENVQINGGQVLKTIWQPYNITPPKPVIYNNANNVYGRAVSHGDTEDIKYLGDFNIFDDCFAACVKFNRNGQTCQSVTWHTPQLPDIWAKQCFACTDSYWAPVGETNHISAIVSARNIYVANLTGQNVQNITGLQVNGLRAVRARFPNANPEIDLFPTGYISSAVAWKPPRSFPQSVTKTLNSPVRATGVAFQKYTVGQGGPCSVFNPPESYWCSSECAGGGASTYIVPSGLTFSNSTFINHWNNPAGAILSAFHPGHWENWIFAVDSYDAASRQLGWTVGGYQGARGSKTGGEWFIENIFEELDFPNEFYYNSVNQQLYYYNNGTGAPSPTTTFVSTNLKVLFNVTGTQSNPVRGMSFHGITFQNSAYTYMDLHGVPSGGDWSLQRSGALFFEGTEGLTVDNCTFQRLDGNALFLSGYTRNATIQNSEFVWIGDSAMAAWGYTVDIDGTGGNFPRYTKILNNFIHELGHYTKQTSAWFQSKTAQTLIKGNIFFNGPRAGININDGFGGANEITNNLIFNFVRETYDHGPVNSWDRQPFLTTVANGTASLNPAYSLVHHNMFICNYGSQNCIDNDDGSTFFKNYNNFEVYGCHKDYFAGHNKYTYDSVLVYPQCWGLGCAFFTEFVTGYVDGMWNVSCFQGSSMPYLNFLDMDIKTIDKTKLPTTSNNVVYNTQGTIQIKIGSTTITEQQWQSMGQDSGTKLLPMPSADVIIAMGKAVLQQN